MRLDIARKLVVYDALKIAASTSPSTLDSFKQFRISVSSSYYVTCLDWLVYSCVLVHFNSVCEGTRNIHIVILRQL